ncbi:hypothetical protein MEE_00808, partial [Bartonella elizabethae F9251 = ATCC 49927]
AWVSGNNSIYGDAKVTGNTKEPENDIVLR